MFYCTVCVEFFNFVAASVCYNKTDTAESFTHGFTQNKFNMISILFDFYLRIRKVERRHIMTSQFQFICLNNLLHPPTPLLEYFFQCMLKQDPRSSLS